MADVEKFAEENNAHLPDPINKYQQELLAEILKSHGLRKCWVDIKLIDGAWKSVLTDKTLVTEGDQAITWRAGHPRSNDTYMSFNIVFNTNTKNNIEEKQDVIVLRTKLSLSTS